MGDSWESFIMDNMLDKIISINVEFLDVIMDCGVSENVHKYLRLAHYDICSLPSVVQEKPV